VTEARRREAMERFAILRPHLEDGAPLPEVAASAGIPLRTAERWLARYRADGITGLARRNPTGHRGRSRGSYSGSSPPPLRNRRA
jgi:putative transposase